MYTNQAKGYAQGLLSNASHFDLRAVTLIKQQLSQLTVELNSGETLSSLVHSSLNLHCSYSFSVAKNHLIQLQSSWQ